jgi:hypothetical protein
MYTQRNERDKHLSAPKRESLQNTYIASSLKQTCSKAPNQIAIPTEYTEPTTNNWQIFLKYLILSKDGSTSSNLIISGFLTINYNYARSPPKYIFQAFDN